MVSNWFLAEPRKALECSAHGIVQPVDHFRHLGEGSAFFFFFVFLPCTCTTYLPFLCPSFILGSFARGILTP